MFVAMFPELVFRHLNENTRKQIEKSSDMRRCIFEKLTVGMNVMDLEYYQKVAEWLLAVDEDKLRELTFDGAFAAVGHYIDDRGYAV